MGCSKSSFKSEVYSYTSLPQETRKISKNQSNFTPKGTRERRTNKTQGQKEIIKIRAEINEIETKKTIAKINATKSCFFQKINRIDKSLARLIKKNTEGFPGGAVVENLPANARDTGSSPGLGRSHMPRSSQAREPQLVSLRVWSLCSTREAAIVRGLRTAMKSGPRLPQLEKALAQKRRPNTAKKKKRKKKERKIGRGLKSVKLKMKKQTLQRTLQKYKAS